MKISDIHILSIETFKNISFYKMCYVLLNMNAMSRNKSLVVPETREMIINPNSRYPGNFYFLTELNRSLIPSE